MLRTVRLLPYSLVGVFLFSASGCINKRLRDLQEQIEDSRAPDARQGVLELDPVSQTRLELLGRTSAPTRYAERTDANRMRVVAFDFGGAHLGQLTDTAGNLLSFRCSDAPAVAVSPRSLTSGEPPPKPQATVDFDFYKGMFRQYGRQIGTTVETDFSVGPVGTTARFYSSHNFLVLEWRRYTLEALGDAARCTLPHVSAIEHGIAVRIIFDVRLRTIDAKMSATFGIADLAAALARSEATVEVSYELVGAVRDLLPRDAIIITSVNEYLNALKNFHAAVSDLSEAWQKYNTVDAKSPGKLKFGDKEFDRDRLFKPEQLAYYVDGVGVGDTYLHLENVEVCEDIRSIHEFYTERVKKLSGPATETGSIAGVKVRVKQLKEQLDKQKGEERLETRKQLREQRAELSELERETKVVDKKLKALDMSYAENACKKTLDQEDKRIAYVCASLKVAEERKLPSDRKYDYIGNATCLQPEAKDPSLNKAEPEAEAETERQKRYKRYFESAEKEIGALIGGQTMTEDNNGKDDKPKDDKPKGDKPRDDKPKNPAPK